MGRVRAAAAWLVDSDGFVGGSNPVAPPCLSGASWLGSLTARCAKAR